jgi:predicted permease
MRDFFRDRLREERAHGAAGVARLWARVLPDLVTVAARERFARRIVPSTVHIPPRTGDNMLQNLGQDLRYSGRIMRKNPVFTAVAIAIVALGTGAVSTIFSAANGLVFRPIPGVAKQSELVGIERTRGDAGGSLSASYLYYRHLADHSKKLTGIVAWSMLRLTVSNGGQGVTSLGNIVSGEYFDVVGARPALGRFFAGDERTVPDAHPVVVVSHAFWQRELGGDSSIVGRTVLVNGSRFTVIGVTEPRFTGLFPVLRTDVWVPLMMQRAVRPRGDLPNPQGAWLELFGRLAPGVTPAEGQAELSALTRQWATSGVGEPADWKRFDAVRLAPSSGLPSDALRGITTFLAVLLAVAGLVLLIASVNVASMLLARAVARRSEIAVRIAVGAGRGRLMRQLLTESLTLFALGGAGGTLLAVWGTRLIERIELPVEMPMALDLSPDLRVLGFTLTVAMITGIVFGLAPALQASRMDIAVSLRGDSAGAGRSRSRLRNALVAGQVALSLVLLTTAGLFVRALERGRRVDPGFDARNVTTTVLDVGTAGYDEAHARAFYRDLRDRLAALPGVAAVGYAKTLPLSMSRSGQSVIIDGYVPPGGRAGDEVAVSVNNVDEGYFPSTRIPVLRGRNFGAADDERQARVAIVNESFGRRYWPGRDPLGRTFTLDSQVVTVVGIVPDTKNARLDEAPEPFMYFPSAQRWRSSTNLLVRGANAAAAIPAAISREIRALDPRLPVPTITSFEQSIAVVLLPQRAAVAVTGVLGIAGLLLAGIGLFGVLSFSVAQRTREIGVRIALGAARGDVLRLVVGEGMRVVSIGMVAGLVLALVATRALTPFLFGVSPVDPLTFVVIGMTLAGTAVVASVIPARRAARLDPAATLRQG